MTSAVRVHRIISGDTYSVSVVIDVARVVVDGKRPLEVILSRAEAMLLDHDLGEAASPPPKCELCNLYATVALDGLNLCAGHHHRAEVEHNMARQVEP